jgi:hypothetical protein
MPQAAAPSVQARFSRRVMNARDPLRERRPMTPNAVRFVLCLLLAVPAAPAEAASNVCAFRAYADSSDPAGVNVRSGPGTSFPIVGVLEVTSDEEDGGEFTPEFDVARFEAGWVEIGDAVAGQYGGGEETTVFTGPGWVSAKLIRFEIEDPIVRSAPDMDAGEVVNLGYMDDADNPWSLGQIELSTIHGCEGEFVDVTLTNQLGETARGWATDLCENQATTCS